MVKEVILIDIELILAKKESLKNIFNPLNTQLNPICHLLALLGAHHILHISRIRVKEQFETKVSWTKVVMMKHKKYNCKEQRVEHTFPVISSRYNLLYNDSKSEDTPISIVLYCIYLHSINLYKDVETVIITICNLHMV